MITDATFDIRSNVCKDATLPSSDATVNISGGTVAIGSRTKLDNGR